MTEQEITIKECLRIIRTARNYSVVRTTYDDMVAKGVQEEIAREVEKYYNLINDDS